MRVKLCEMQRADAGSASIYAVECLATGNTIGLLNIKRTEHGERCTPIVRTGTGQGVCLPVTGRMQAVEALVKASAAVSVGLGKKGMAEA